MTLRLYKGTIWFAFLGNNKWDSPHRKRLRKIHSDHFYLLRVKCVTFSTSAFKCESKLWMWLHRFGPPPVSDLLSSQLPSIIYNCSRLMPLLWVSSVGCTISMLIKFEKAHSACQRSRDNVRIYTSTAQILWYCQMARVSHRSWLPLKCQLVAHVMGRSTAAVLPQEGWNVWGRRSHPKSRPLGLRQTLQPHVWQGDRILNWYFPRLVQVTPTSWQPFRKVADKENYFCLPHYIGNPSLVDP